MTMTGPESYKESGKRLRNAEAQDSNGDYEQSLHRIAQIQAMHALTSVGVMLTEVICTATGVNHYELDAWRKVLPADTARPEPDKPVIPADLFERRWHCRVVSTGYNNGAGCIPKDPHDPEDWRCGYRWLAPALTDVEARELGLPVGKEN